MINIVENSNLYIALVGNPSTLDDKAEKYVNNVFKDIFEGTATLISEVKENDGKELIYSILTPIMKDNSLIKEFFESLEILLDVLKDFYPHFTQMERGNV